jgi:DNA-binding NarL/FixJ family response regulator
MRIVLATGEADLRLSIELMLSEQPGVKILGGASESEGFLALVESTCPDLALVDWNLPGRPMEELLGDIKQFKQHPKLIVLVARERSRAKVLESGADAYVVKGKPPEFLLAAVMQFHAKEQPDKS